MNKLIRTIGIFSFASLALLWSCGHQSGSTSEIQGRLGDASAQDGGVVLLVEKADLLQLEDRPEYNTAEWLVTVDKPGRYDIWLSSLTLDTLQLNYSDDVIVTAGETRLTKMPLGDLIVTGDKSVTGPWYRADSHMGSVFFSKPGEYPVQVISDKLESRSDNLSNPAADRQTLITSLIIKPIRN